MQSTRPAICLAALTILGCDTEDLGYAQQSEVLSVENENASLRDQLEAMKAELTALTEQMAELRSVYQVHDGDAVIEGANLHIRSGQGRTDCFPTDACNGKGNLIIGYDELRNECVDSDERNGLSCSSDNQCPGGTCASVSRPHKTGSHNLVVGSGHTYTGSASVVFGKSSSISGAYVSVLGGSNNTADGYNTVVVGGSVNTAAGVRNTIIGGRVNAAEGRNNVVVGGFENSTRGEAYSSVMLGHYGHEMTTAGDIAPDIQSVQRPWEDMDPPNEQP